MTETPLPLQSLPGVKRDGTAFEGDNYSEALWCRFTARGLPRKIAGYQSVTSQLPEIVRGMDLFAQGATAYLHMGSATKLTQVQVDMSGALGIQSDRTPAGLVASADNLWQLTAFYNKVSGKTSIIGHPGQNLSSISNSVETKIFYGDVDGTGALAQSAMDPVSGGILALPPYLVAFSNSGRVDLSATNDPTAATAASAFVTAQKIVRGMSIRGSTPSALLWSLDSIVSMIFNPNLVGTMPFDFNEISTSISILSSQSVVEFDSLYYWPGVDRFWVFSGVAQELPNDLNIDFFFDNLNFTYAQKAFAFKVPRWGEIWFCAPLFNATEPNWAIIYNTRLKTWYDTPLPDGGRSAAIFAKVYRRPFMCDLDPILGNFTLWQHEIGVDKILGSTLEPIRSYYRTHEMSPITLKQSPIDKALKVSIVEPDFNQSGDLVCTIYGRANARVDASPLASVSITPPPVDSDAQLTFFKKNTRLCSFQFESNTVGGDFTAGRIIGHLSVTDGRMTQ